MPSTTHSEKNPTILPGDIRGAQVLVSCDALEPDLAFWVDRLGFRVDAIFPADNPSTAMLSGHGLHMRLVQGAAGGASVL